MQPGALDPRVTCRQAGGWGGGARRRGTAVLGGLLLLSVPAGGQPSASPEPEYLVRAWETADGLPENSATAMVQTRDGYLWFGTFDGLVRFNGIGFTVLNPGNTPGLPSAGIVNLHLDARDRLWVSTYEGLAVREPDGERWRSLGAGQGWSGDFVRTFAERESGDMLLTSFHGRVFESVGDRLAELPPPPGEVGQGYLGGVDEDGSWWVVQNRFVGRWREGRWESMIQPPEMARDAVGCAPARGGGLWVLLGRDLLHVRRGETVSRRVLAEEPGGVWSMTEDGRGQVWIATHNRGVCRVDGQGGVGRWTAANGVSDNGRFVFEDREGNLWVGSSGDGLFRLNPRRFQTFSLREEAKALVVSSVCPAPDGGIWAATYGRGLHRLDGTGMPGNVPDGMTAVGSFLQSVLADRAGRLWVGTLGQGLWLLDAQGVRTLPPVQTAGGNPIALFEDSEGGVWISGGSQGVARFDGTEFRLFGPADGLAATNVHSFAETTAGTLWLSDGDRVFLRERGRPFVEVPDGNSGPLRGVACLLADRGEAMWLGSSERGLLRWDGGQITRIRLPVDAVNGMMEDQHGHLWLTSGHRLLRVRTDNLHAAARGTHGAVSVLEFDHHDGLPRAEFSTGRQPVCARDAEGRLWFATIKGVAQIDPANLRLNDIPPAVVVERISYHRPGRSASGGGVRWDNSEEAVAVVTGPFRAPVRLPPGSRRIEIHYAGLSYAVPERVRFQVKLEGRDAYWYDAADQRVAVFHELLPRAYVFRVRAANNDGVWNETGASLAFTVLPHAWETPWFRGGAGLLLFGLGAGAVWQRARQRMRRAEERERVAAEISTLAGRLISAQEDERRRLARELHDDFSQRLALLSVELELLDSRPATGNPPPQGRLEEIAQRVKELSTEVHRLAYELHPAKLEQLGLVAAARALCRELTQKSGVSVVFEPDEFPRDLPADVALCFYRVLQESLRNVVRHSHAPEARVELRTEPGRWCLRVCDAGRGFNPARVPRDSGLGLLSMQERVRQVHGRIQVLSAPNRGTTIEVCVPHPPPGAP